MAAALSATTLEMCWCKSRFFRLPNQIKSPTAVAAAVQTSMAAAAASMAAAAAAAAVVVAAACLGTCL
jgi:hypothetical protein